MTQNSKTHATSVRDEEFSMNYSNSSEHGKTKVDSYVPNQSVVKELVEKFNKIHPAIKLTKTKSAAAGQLTGAEGQFVEVSSKATSAVDLGQNVGA